MQKRAERPPGQGAPDIIQTITRLCKQIMLNGCFMRLDKIREAYDSPREVFSSS